MNIQERIEALETEFAEKIKSLKAEAQQRDEFPQDGDEYWFIDSTGEVVNEKWEGLSFEIDRLEFGNIFKTKEQVEFAFEKLKVEAELRKFSKPFEYNGFNHYIFLDTYSDCLGVDSLSYSQSQGTIHFESEEKADKAIETVGADRIKKFIFGVED